MNDPGDDLSALDPPLDQLPFSRRLRDMAAARGAFTLRQIARIPPTSLAPPGSTLVGDARVILERLLGRTWEEMAGLTPPRPVSSDAPPRLPAGWDELRLVLPSPLRIVPLDDLDLPSRVGSYAERGGLRTLGDLATRSEARLLEWGGIGRIAVRQLFRAISSAAVRAGHPVTLPPPAAIGPVAFGAPIPVPRKKRNAGVLETGRKTTNAGFLETWQRHLAALPPEHRRAMELLAGIDGSPRLTFAGAGAEMGVSGARAHRLDVQARAMLSRNGAWMEEVRARFSTALQQPRVRLARLAGDPFWAEIVIIPQALDYFAESVLGLASVIDLAGKLYLVKWEPEG